MGNRRDDVHRHLLRRRARSSGGSACSIFFFILLFFFFVGRRRRDVYVRWKANGLVVFFLALGVAAGRRRSRCFTYTQQLGRRRRVLRHRQALGVSAWLLVPTALAGIAGFLVLRRATPRS